LRHANACEQTVWQRTCDRVARQMWIARYSNSRAKLHSNRRSAAAACATATPTGWNSKGSSRKIKRKNYYCAQSETERARRDRANPQRHSACKCKDYSIDFANYCSGSEVCVIMRSFAWSPTEPCLRVQWPSSQELTPTCLSRHWLRLPRFHLRFPLVPGNLALRLL